MILDTSRDEASKSYLGNLFQCLPTVIVKNFVLPSNINLFSILTNDFCSIAAGPGKNALSLLLITYI